MTATPARPKLARAALAVVALALVLLAGVELLARAFVPASPPTFSSHPYAGHVWAPNLAIEYRTRGGEGEKITLETNAFGFRGRSMKTAEKPAGTRRVFFLGASVMAGVDFREEETIPGLVEGELGARFKGTPRFECPNAAVSGVGVRHTFSTLAHLVVPLEPDAVVLYEGTNDELESVDPRWDATHFAERVEAPDRLSRWLWSRSRVLQVLSRWRGERGHNPFLERPPLANARPLEGFDRPFDPEPGLRDFATYLSMIDAVARARKIKLVVVTQPALWREGPLPEAERAAISQAHRFGPRVDVPALARLHARYLEVVRAFARDGGHVLVDAEAAVPKDVAHFTDDVHLTLEGNRQVARLIAEALSREPP